MASKTKKSKPAGGHTSVSNISQAPSEFPEVTRSVSKQPSEGVNPKTTKTRPDGAEAVKGFKAKLAPEAAAAEIAAPDTSKLKDIGEASFGPPPPLAETVHGPDDRVRITTTGSYPWRIHASLLITAADGSRWVGTAWFISPRTLITAGHCVYIKNSGVPGRDGWVRSIDVMPGRNGSSLPYGTARSSDFRATTGWTGSGDENFDYGAIILPTDLGNKTGWIGFGVYSDAELAASVGNISGYPGDKPSGTQWYDARRIDSVNTRKVYYDIDTMGGQSGSAVYRIINGARIAIAIHAYGGATTNSGTRINRPVYDNLVAWRV
jgi:V8-like Glu-specific endopeptidase